MTAVPPHIENPATGEEWMHGCTREYAELELGGPVVEVIMVPGEVPEEYRDETSEWWVEVDESEHGERFWRLAE